MASARSTNSRLQSVAARPSEACDLHDLEVSTRPRKAKYPHASPNPLRAATSFCRDGPRGLGPKNPHTRSRKHGLESVHLCMYSFDKSSKFAITWLMTCGGIYAIYQLARSLWVERVCQSRVIAQDDYVSSPKFAPRIPHLAPVTPK
jgi:hypothetical protein